MAPAPLLTSIPSTLEKALGQNLQDGEQVFVKIRGAFKEALICTDRRVLIAKAGFMTGQTFGSDMFQIPYSGIASVEVKFRIMSGYFEVSAGGVQNAPKHYWSSSRSQNPSMAPNCVSLNRTHVGPFRAASSFIMERVTNSRNPAKPSQYDNTREDDLPSALERLFRLKLDGALTNAEFEVAKKKLLIKD